MIHVALQEIKDGKDVHWLEHVSDAKHDA